MFSSCDFDQERTIFVDSQNLVKSETSDITGIFVLMEKLSMSKTSILRDSRNRIWNAVFMHGYKLNGRC